MSKYIPGNQKQLTLENRIYIENELNKGTFFKDIARFADRKYREKLRDSRTGINMTKRELRQKDQIISPLIDQGLFTARNVDLKRKVHFKPRKCHKIQITDRALFANRSYCDFCSLSLTDYIQMDTVHSSRESKKPC